MVHINFLGCRLNDVDKISTEKKFSYEISFVKTLKPNTVKCHLYLPNVVILYNFCLIVLSPRAVSNFVNIRKKKKKL